MHDGIAGSVDHTTQSEQTAARHALEEEKLMTDEGIWSAAVKRPLDVNSLDVAGIDGVDDEDMPTIRALCKVWRDRYPYNLIRSSYYFARYRFKDFGISIPDRIRANVSACVGWPAKAVRALADLSVFDGWDLGGVDPYGVRGLADETSLELAIPQTIVSAYMHGCAFLTITKDAEDVIVTPSGIQCRHLVGRHNRLAAVLTINDVTINDVASKGRITAFNVFFPNTLLPIQLGGIGHRDDLRRLRRRRNPQGAIGNELRIGHAHRHPAVQRIRGIRACCFRPKREHDRAQRRHHVRHHQANRPVTTVRMECTIRQHQPDLSGQHRHLPGHTNRCQRIRSHGWPRAYRQT